jgi:hypothetical protein
VIGTVIRTVIGTGTVIGIGIATRIGMLVAPACARHSSIANASGTENAAVCFRDPDFCFCFFCYHSENARSDDAVPRSGTAIANGTGNSAVHLLLHLLRRPPTCQCCPAKARFPVTDCQRHGKGIHSTTLRLFSLTCCASSQEVQRVRRLHHTGTGTSGPLHGSCDRGILRHDPASGCHFPFVRRSLADHHRVEGRSIR